MKSVIKIRFNRLYLIKSYESRSMKNIFCFLLLFCLTSCTKDDDGTKHNLPSESTEGKNTFGCKIDGVTFLPRSLGGFSAGYKFPILSANYFKLDEKYYDFEPGYHLRIIAINEITNKDIVIKLIRSDQPLMEGKTYPINIEGDGLFNARYSAPTTEPAKDIKAYIYTDHIYKTSEEYSGEIKITKIDEVNLIISGNFWFDCINKADNTTAKISDGRFDIKYVPYVE